ncbi:glycosyltransferase involved in cell wall biosynthesis [Sulfuritortus calidifontis]|uniref:Glycosyltransferase involved in cell wall biosynthesis n=1 Tax=Sulfuritortus calidifontis TaxID=1914471 RepID=A0A4R3JWN6_9PROT|nr:glycosyltransferase [Sulfuritortus calidifontis]TCS72673.1 glycosyltransferase involved in cell wall biosynthesis [Sulfuritortus calidifontis]
MEPAQNPLDVSIVIPVYNEFDNLPDLVEQVEKAMTPANVKWELICVDDGSRDGSDRRLAELAEARPWLKPLYLNRNYGQSTAMQAGFDAAAGNVLITLDGDLQNDPADIPRLLKELEAHPEIDVLSGWRKDRQDRTLSRKIPSRIANALISKVTGVSLHDYGCSLKLYRREALANVKIYGELHRFIPALAAQFGARVMELPVNHRARTRGVSKYGIDRTIRVLLDLLWVKFLLRFLHRPMHAFGSVGAVMLVPGLLALAYLVGLKLFTGADIGHRPLLLLGVMFTLMGAQFIGMGLLGEMLTRIYHEPAGQKQYVLRDAPRKSGVR